MHIVIEGDASPRGWPVSGCRCASCAFLPLPHAPTRVLLDGVLLGDCPSGEVPGGLDVRAPGGGRVLYGLPGTAPEPAPGAVYDAVVFDVLADPAHLGLLRRSGAVGPATEVHAVHVDDRVRSEAELARRLGFWGASRPGPHRTLLLGGSRSGKSAEAELRLLAEPEVTYVATGPVPSAGDPEWARRVGEHRARRPPAWRTIETTDLAGVLRGTGGAVLVDGLGTWLAAVMDARAAWEDPAAVRPCFDELTEAWRQAAGTVVAVTDEVGMALVPRTPSGRLFRDLLGSLNQLLAAESEEVALIVAGRVHTL
ncbi:bifunctional adenosylcobinamide kinase/adenosylcobinamide-phosphate guanylyltransferase [Actinocorallia longicatena]|uniref:Adenosylcobinamide kinase n=1 Tax=Actinocorallia longicatena TaxID=111803 RepID=A0ABP6QCE5_9ACTN